MGWWQNLLLWEKIFFVSASLYVLGEAIYYILLPWSKSQFTKSSSRDF